MRYAQASGKANYYFSLLLAGLFFGLTHSPSCAKQSLVLPDRFPDFVNSCEKQADYIHPVLGVKAGTSILGKYVDDRMLLKLNRFKFSKDLPSEEIRCWSNYFSRCEAEAAWIFCNRVVGLTKKQVRAIIGNPSFIFSKADGAPLESNHEFWMYSIGASWITIVVEFDRDKCLRANDYKTIWGLEKYLLLVNWRLDKLSQFAIGKTRPEILRELTTSVLSRFDYGDSAGELRYFLIKNSGLDFTFKDGKCVKAEEFIVGS